MHWSRKRTYFTALIVTLFISAWTIAFAGALVDWVEIEIGRGGSIDFSLRVYFSYAVGLVLIAFAYLLVVVGSNDPRLRFVLAALILACVTLLLIWLFDRVEFTSEYSKMRFVTSIALIGAATASFINAVLINRMTARDGVNRLFWYILAAAFMAGGIDEYFAIHEWIASALTATEDPFSRSYQLAQDGITILYAIGAILFIAIFLRPFRGEMLKPGQISGWLMLWGIVLYGFAVSNDTFDFFAEKMFPVANPEHAMNFAEEMFELIAATLFLCSASIAVYERRPEIFQAGSPMLKISGTVKRTANILLLLVFLASITLPVVLLLVVPNDSYAYSSKHQFAMSVFADARDGLDSVDELLYVAGVGLLVSNEGSGEVLLIDQQGNSRPLLSNMVSPDSLAFNRNTLYVTDDVAGEVRKYSMHGQLLEVDANWISPEGVIVDGSGNLYVADAAMRLVARISDYHAVPVATSIDGLRSPEQLAMDSNGDLFIADERARSIFRYRQSGPVERFAGVASGIGTPESLQIRGGELFVVDSSKSLVHRFGLDGSSEIFISFAKRHNLSGIAFDPSGVIFVAITSDLRSKNVILRFSPTESRSIEHLH